MRVADSKIEDRYLWKLMLRSGKDFNDANASLRNGKEWKVAKENVDGSYAMVAIIRKHYFTSIAVSFKAAFKFSSYELHKML